MKRDTNVDAVEHGQPRGLTIWLTGLSGSGKSTLSAALQARLRQRYGLAVASLDGDALRKGLCADLSYSPEDRQENIRRIAHVARLMAQSGLISIVACISPYKKDRDMARQIHQTSNIAFIEVFVKVSLEAAEKRDPKGLYKKARQGRLKDFTGIDAPYEAPSSPDVVLDTLNDSLEECLGQLLAHVLPTAKASPLLLSAGATSPFCA